MWTPGYEGEEDGDVDLGRCGDVVKLEGRRGIVGPSQWLLGSSPPGRGNGNGEREETDAA